MSLGKLSVKLFRWMSKKTRTKYKSPPTAPNSSDRVDVVTSHVSDSSCPPTRCLGSSCLTDYSICMMWPVLSRQIGPKGTNFKINFYWNHLNQKRSVWLHVSNSGVFPPRAELQSFGLHGRPLPRLQVLLSFGDECLDPQRQRRTLSVQVRTQHNLYLSWGSVGQNLLLGGEIRDQIKRNLAGSRNEKHFQAQSSSTSEWTWRGGIRHICSNSDSQLKGLERETKGTFELRLREKWILIDDTLLSQAFKPREIPCLTQGNRTKDKGGTSFSQFTSIVSVTFWITRIRCRLLRNMNKTLSHDLIVNMIHTSRQHP